MTPVHAARATRLYGFCRCTLVVEARSAYSNDRTWCFWGDPSVAAPYPTRHHWQTLRVANAGNSVLLDCGSTPCQRAAAQDFYATAQALIDRQPNVTLSLGTAVIGEPGHSGGVWSIRTPSGSITAHSLVDTRPPLLPQHNAATLWQSSYGQEVECSAAVFDPSSLDLMNFLAPDLHDAAPRARRFADGPEQNAPLGTPKLCAVGRDGRWRPAEHGLRLSAHSTLVC